MFTWSSIQEESGVMFDYRWWFLVRVGGQSEFWSGTLPHPCRHLWAHLPNPSGVLGVGSRQERGEEDGGVFTQFNALVVEGFTGELLLETFFAWRI
jgi:hypothetical protein